MRKLICERCGNEFPCHADEPWESLGTDPKQRLLNSVLEPLKHPGPCWCERRMLHDPAAVQADLEESGYKDCICPDCLREMAEMMTAHDDPLSVDQG